MVLKLSIRTLALPRWKQSYWGLRLTQNAYFSPLIHAMQAFCDMTAGIGPSFRTHTRTHGTTATRKDGQTNVEVEIVI